MTKPSCYIVAADKLLINWRWNPYMVLSFMHVYTWYPFPSMKYAILFQCTRSVMAETNLYHLVWLLVFLRSWLLSLLVLFMLVIYYFLFIIKVHWCLHLVLASGTLKTKFLVQLNVETTQPYKLILNI